MYVNFGNNDFTVGDCRKVFEKHLLPCKGLSAGLDFFNVADALITADKRYAALAASHEKLVQALKKAELDCRGYDAVHDWLEEAEAALGQAEKLTK